MNRFPVILLLVAFFAVGLVTIGCGDENDPIYWVEKLSDRPERALALKMISGKFGSLKQASKGDLAAPEVKAYTDRVVPGLIEAYKSFQRDRINRLEIIKLLAQMGNPLANEIFLAGLDVEGATDSQIFVISAEALARGGVVESLPKLLAAHNVITGERDSRGGTPFTKRENEIEDALVSALIAIATKNPNVPERAQIVGVLAKVADTRDILQDLRINMKAVKGLGQLGDAAAIPTLVRAIAMQGEVQKVGLGPFAFVSLQQIADRDKVVDAILAFGMRKDAAFNQYFKEEIQSDPVLRVPVWHIQQAVDFLGTLNYPTEKAIAFLSSELNHNTPDEVDKQSAEKGEESQKFTAEQWVAWRRNWASVALAQLGYKPVLDAIKERFKLKKGEGGRNVLDVTLEEAAGFLRAIGYLQYPAESCPLLLEVANANIGSESLRDKVLYYGGIMCGKEFLPVMQQEYDKIDCKKVVAERFGEESTDEEKKKAEVDCETLKGRIKTYMDGITFAQSCGQDFDCFLSATNDRRNAYLETAIYGAYRLARGDAGKSKQLVEALSKGFDNPVMAILEANIFVLDRLTPDGDKNLLARAEEVRAGFASQQAYKDRSRYVEAFIGHLKARTK